MESKYDLIIKKVALKHKLSTTEVKKMVESQFEFINNKAKSFDFASLKSKEEFDKLETNFTVKFLFTMFANYNAIQKINNKRDEAKCKDS